MVETREPSPSYWTVYRGRKYLGAIARKQTAYRAVIDGVVHEPFDTLEAAVELFEAKS